MFSREIALRKHTGVHTYDGECAVSVVDDLERDRRERLIVEDDRPSRKQSPPLPIMAFAGTVMPSLAPAAPRMNVQFFFAAIPFNAIAPVFIGGITNVL